MSERIEEIRARVTAAIKCGRFSLQITGAADNDVRDAGIALEHAPADLVFLLCEVDRLRSEIENRALVDHDLRRKLEASLDKERDAYGLLMAAEVERDDARAAIIQALSCLEDCTRTDSARMAGARELLRGALSGVPQ